MANTEKKHNDNVIVALVIVVIISVIAILINQTRDEIKDKNKTENNNTQSDKNNKDKEQFVNTSQDYLTESYTKKLIEICKTTAPTKTYQAGGKNFVVIDRKVYQVTDEDYGLFTVNEKCR